MLPTQALFVHVISIDVNLPFKCVYYGDWGVDADDVMRSALASFFKEDGQTYFTEVDFIDFTSFNIDIVERASDINGTETAYIGTEVSFKISVVIEELQEVFEGADVMFEVTSIQILTGVQNKTNGLYKTVRKYFDDVGLRLLDPSTFRGDSSCIGEINDAAFTIPREYCVRAVSATPAPTIVPSPQPSPQPTATPKPSPIPSFVPTGSPSFPPSPEPTGTPSVPPTPLPTIIP